VLAEGPTRTLAKLVFESKSYQPAESLATLLRIDLLSVIVRSFVRTDASHPPRSASGSASLANSGSPDLPAEIDRETMPAMNETTTWPSGCRDPLKAVEIQLSQIVHVLSSIAIETKSVMTPARGNGAGGSVPSALIQLTSVDLLESLRNSQALEAAFLSTAELQAATTKHLRGVEKLCFLFNLHNLLLLHGTLLAVIEGADVASMAAQASENPRAVLMPWRRSLWYRVGDLGLIDAEDVLSMILACAKGAFISL